MEYQDKRNIVDRFAEFYSLFRGSYLEAYVGLYHARKKTGDPEECPYVRLARNKAIEDINNIIKMLRVLGGKE
jgi:hypothetical protein